MKFYFRFCLLVVWKYLTQKYPLLLLMRHVRLSRTNRRRDQDIRQQRWESFRLFLVLMFVGDLLLAFILLVINYMDLICVFKLLIASRYNILVFFVCLNINSFPLLIMSFSLLWRHIVLLMVGVYLSNHGVLYSIGISMTRRFKKKCRSICLCLFVRPFVTLTKKPTLLLTVE